MKTADIALRSVPIPGMSLTKEPGNNPWEQPPMFVELPDVVKFYTEELTSDESVTGIIQALSNDISVLDLSNTLMKTSVMKGIHSIDVGMIAIPVIAEIIKTVGDLNNVGYITSTEEYEKATKVDEKMLMELLNESKEAVEEKLDEAPAKGLMARGKK